MLFILEINLIIDCGSGLTAPIQQTLVAASTTFQPESFESVVQPGVLVPSLPPQLLGTLAHVEQIGGGAYGDVQRGFWTPPGKAPIPVAIKCIKPPRTDLPQDQNYAILVRVWVSYLNRTSSSC